MTVIVLLAGVGRARALPVTYAAPPGCRELAEFVGDIEARVVAGAGSHIQSVHVAIDRAGAGFRARVEVVDREGIITERAIQDASCPDLSRAAALVAALAFREPAPLARASAEQAPDLDPADAAAEPSSKAPARAEVSGARAERKGILWEAGAVTVAGSGFAPRTSWGALAYVEAGVWERLSVRLNAGARTSPALQLGPGTAQFAWVGARVDGCLRTLWRRERPGLDACAALEAGALRGRGRAIDLPSTALQPWVSVGALLRPRWRTGRIIVEGEAAIFVPLTRERFIFGTEQAPEATLYSPEVLSWHAGLGAGLPF